MKKIVVTVVAAASIILSGRSMAAEPTPAVHTIDLTVVLTDFYNKPIPDVNTRTEEDKECKKCSPLTLGSALATALLAVTDKDRNLSALEKAKRGWLAHKIFEAKSISLSVDELHMIESCLDVWPQAILFRIYPLIDPDQKLGDK